MRCLVVDENKSFRNYIKELIILNNNECMELDDGINLNSVYREYRPGWVLIDLQMEKMNGFKAAEKLIEEFPEACIALVSDFYDERLRNKAEKIGAAAFIPKENLTEKELKTYLYL